MKMQDAKLLRCVYHININLIRTQLETSKTVFELCLQHFVIQSFPCIKIDTSLDKFIKQTATNMLTGMAVT